jgi:hypothetical protein
MKAIVLIVPLCLSIVTSLSAGTIGVDTPNGSAGLGGGLTAGYEFEVTNTNGITVDGYFGLSGTVNLTVTPGLLNVPLPAAWN